MGADRGQQTELPKPRFCKTASEIMVGDRIELAYKISLADALKFAELSGDFNPIHLNESYARKSIFGERIAHGALSLAKFSGIFGMDLPGLGTLWESQTVFFRKAVFLERDYKAVCEVINVQDRRVRFATWVEDDSGYRVLEGEATMIPITDPQRKRINTMLPSLLKISDVDS